VDLKADVDDAVHRESWLHGAAQCLRHGTTTLGNIETRPDLLPELWAATPLRMLSFLELIVIRTESDAAQAVTAQYKGRPVGSLGSAGCFSLHPLKTLNACGDGGVMTTDDTDIFRRVSLSRNLGLKTREEATIWSSNSRLDTIQAAILLVKLRYLNDWTEKRRANARYYQQHLADVAQVQVPLDKPYERAVYHTFVVQADSRDDLSRYLADHGIGTGIHYPIPIHLQEAASHLEYEPGSFPVVEQHSQRILSLPVHHGLGEADTRHVVTAIREFYRQ